MAPYCMPHIWLPNEKWIPSSLQSLPWGYRTHFSDVVESIAKNCDYSGKPRVTLSDLLYGIHHWLFCLLFIDYLRIQNLGYFSCIICPHWNVNIAVYSQFMLVYLNTYKASNTQGIPWKSKYSGFCSKWRQNSAITQGNPGLPWVFSLMLVEYTNNLPKIPQVFITQGITE